MIWWNLLGNLLTQIMWNHALYVITSDNIWEVDSELVSLLTSDSINNELMKHLGKDVEEGLTNLKNGAEIFAI